MILTIGQYLEAINNAEGRFRTLRKVYPVKDNSGDPVFSMPGHGLVDLEIMAGDEPYTLRCPLKCDSLTAGRLRALCERDMGLGSRFFTEWIILDKEIVLFDTSGNSIEVDILARAAAQGEKVASFLQRASSAGSSGVLYAALGSFGELVEWAYDKGCDGIVPGKLAVLPEGDVYVTGFSANDESPYIALSMLFTAVAPGCFAQAGLPFIDLSSESRALAEKLCAAASQAGFPEPAQMLAGDIAGAVRKISARTQEELSLLGDKVADILGGSKDNTRSEGYAWSEDGNDDIKCVRDGAGWRYVDRFNRPVIDTVWAAAGPFREGRAEVRTKTGKGLIALDGTTVIEPVYEELAWDEQWGLVSVMSEGRWSLLDGDGKLLTKDQYEWLGECSEGLILVQKEGKCGFVDTTGREVIPAVYDDATSFSEGCSLVTCGTSSFFIDSRGRTTGSDT